MPSVAILGAGTMGAGIAQVAAQSGWIARVTDVDPQRAAASVESVCKALQRLTEKGKLTPDASAAAQARLQVLNAPADLHDCELVIEAVVENLDVKAAVLAAAARAARRDAVLASNTSSLSISRIAEAVARQMQQPSQADSGGAAEQSDVPRRLVGMHFFNPVPIMPLVEIIASRDSDEACLQRAAAIARGWGKSTVRAQDTPGFIVNRVARGYYLESLRMLGEGVASLDEIDRTLKTLGGFRLGPFELMDMIGIDINYTVSCSVWEQLGKPARLTPHALQRDLFDRGQFGRKTGRGFYAHDREPPLPALVLPRRSFDCPPRLYEAVRRVCTKAAIADGSQTEQYVYARVLIAIINEAGLLLDEKGATAADIDLAMKLGTNYPVGPFEMADRVGRHTCAALLRALNETVPDGRFAPAQSLT